jgi:hypothetical protein
MERNRLDLEIKQKLDSRAIQPSAQAWGRLEAMLDADQKTKSRSRISWISIAASFIGFVFIATVFYNYQDVKKISTTTPLVLEQKKEPTHVRVEGKSSQATRAVQVVKLNAIATEAIAEATKVSTHSKEEYTVNTSLKQQHSIADLKKQDNKSVDAKESKINQIPVGNSYISAEKLLAEVSNLNFEAKTSDKTKENTKNSFSINPNSLLSTAEKELNQTFRESTLVKLNKNFNAVKTALVNRNYQE